MFGAIAGRYDLNNRLHSFGRDQAWRRAAVRLCRVQPTDHVLDVACGTGDLAEAFCRAGPALGSILAAMIPGLSSSYFCRRVLFP